jgi:signal transduction histidine kinase
LQSLYALTSAAPREGEVDATHAALLNRQLPQLTKRLQATLDQLRAPEVETSEIASPARAWWIDVQRRYGGTEVRLAATIEADVTIPQVLFDSFLENCIANARAKRERDGPLDLGATLAATAGGVTLEVWDGGAAVPESILPALFRDPVARPREPGLGIGLYQVARLAAQWGYAVRLASNHSGKVSFRLEAAGSGSRETVSPSA